MADERVIDERVIDEPMEEKEAGEVNFVDVFSTPKRSVDQQKSEEILLTEEALLAVEDLFFDTPVEVKCIVSEKDASIIEAPRKSARLSAKRGSNTEGDDVARKSKRARS